MASVVPVGILTPRSSRVRVRGRILKLWDARRAQQMPFGKNFVLIDAEGGAIQGLILAIKFSQVATFFVEGRVCELGRFTVRPVSFGCRTVSHEYSLLLNKDAMVSDLGDSVSSIPLCYFELARLEDIGTDKFPKDAIMDVMGRLSGFAPVEHVMSKGVELRIRKMYLMNERGYMAEVALWDNYVDRFDVDALAAKSVVSPVIVGCSSLQVREFRGVYGLKTFIPSRFFIDVDCSLFCEFRARLPSDLPVMFLDGIGSAPGQDGVSGLPVLTSAAKKVSLRELRPFEELSESTTYECVAEIVNLNDRFGWYYPACPQCCRRAVDAEGFTKCVNLRCVMNEKKVDAIPWYRIPVEVSDNTDRAEFVLLGKHGECVVGSTAIKVVSENDLQSEDAPEPLLDIIGKRFLFVFAVSKIGGYAKHRNFTVSRVLPVPGDDKPLEIAGPSSPFLSSDSVNDRAIVPFVSPTDSGGVDYDVKLKGVVTPLGGDVVNASASSSDLSAVVSKDGVVLCGSVVTPPDTNIVTVGDVDKKNLLGGSSSSHPVSNGAKRKLEFDIDTV